MEFEAIKATADQADEIGHVYVHSWLNAYKGIIPDKAFD